MSDLVAYAAGFFDGEGCISLETITRDGKLHEHRLRCVTSQKYSDKPLHIMADLFGGKVSLYATGITKHIVNGRKAVAMLEQMMPYLTVKFDQAEIAVRMFELDQAGREAARADLSRLKKTYSHLGA